MEITLTDRYKLKTCNALNMQLCGSPCPIARKVTK